MNPSTPAAGGAGDPGHGAGGTSQPTTDAAARPGVAGGPIAYFPFDEASGTAVVNVQDPLRSGTCIGTCLRLSGVIGNAVRIRNANANVDWIQLPQGLVSNLSALTISLWVRVLAKDRKDAPAFHFSLGDREAVYFTPDDVNPTASVSGAAFGVKHDGVLVVSIRGTEPLTDERWHHVAVTWDADAIAVVVDNKLLGTKTDPRVLPSTLGATTADYLGRALRDDIVAFSGDLDELRIYDRVLDEREVEALYNAR